MSATEQVSEQYRVQAYKKIIGDDNAVRFAPCMRDEADEWWIEQLVGPDRWTKFDERANEHSAVRRLAELSECAPMAKTHYGYSTPRI